MDYEIFAGVQTQTKATLANVLDAVAPLTCVSCGEVFHLAADEMPLDTGTGAIVCEECYHTEYEFTCCWCEEYDRLDYQHGLLVVFDAEEAGLELPGLYRIHGQAPCTWLGPFTGRAAHPHGDPCGHLCRDCQAKALGRHAMLTAGIRSTSVHSRKHHPLDHAHTPTATPTGALVYVVCGWDGCAQRLEVDAAVWEAELARRAAASPGVQVWHARGDRLVPVAPDVDGRVPGVAAPGRRRP